MVDLVKGNPWQIREPKAPILPNLFPMMSLLPMQNCFQGIPLKRPSDKFREIKVLLIALIIL